MMMNTQPETCPGVFSALTITRVMRDGGALGVLDENGESVYISRATADRFAVEAGDRYGALVVPNARSETTIPWFARRIAKKLDTMPPALVARVADLLSGGATWTADDVADTLADGPASAKDRTYAMAALEELYSKERAAKAVVMRPHAASTVYYTAPGRLVIELAD